MTASLELNACLGGMSEGFRRAGLAFDVAVDWDENACDSHEANLGLRPICMDVRDLVRLARSGIFRPELRILVADPPCTPWSMAGDRKGLDDERDLLRETMDLVLITRPRCWLVGNVPGLDQADNPKKVLGPVVYAPSAKAGYCVDYARLGAEDFGVPQRRHRPFWFGHPIGTSCLAWPRPTHVDPPVLAGLGLRQHVTCGEALEAVFGPRDGWGEEVGRVVRLRKRGANGVPYSSPGSPALGVGTSNLSDGNMLVLEDRARRSVHKKRGGSRPVASEADAVGLTAREWLGQLGHPSLREGADRPTGLPCDVEGLRQDEEVAALPDRASGAASARRGGGEVDRVVARTSRGRRAMTLDRLAETARRAGQRKRDARARVERARQELAEAKTEFTRATKAFARAIKRLEGRFEA